MYRIRSCSSVACSSIFSRYSNSFSLPMVILPPAFSINPPWQIYCFSSFYTTMR
nr:MAG TPA: hypothetical protein [Caudoviricetes sp.]